MKKLYFYVLTFFAALTTINAQVVLTESNHAPSVGDSYEMYQVDSSLVSPGASGTSAVWTFTTAEYTRTNVLISNTYTTPSSVSSGSLYPSATVVGTAGNVKRFYSSSPSQLSFWGGNFTASSFNVDYYFSTAANHAPYTFVYGQSATSSFTGNAKVGAVTANLTNGTSTVSADGQGTLNLPNRSFSNVLRVKTYTGFDFSVPFPPISGSAKTEQYDYYTSLTELPSTKSVPLFSIVNLTVVITTTSTTTQTSVVTYLNRDYQYVGIKDNVSEISELNIFPNPADNNFNLIFMNENASEVTVELFNTLGQKVQKETYTGTKGLSTQNVDVTKLESGVYFVKVNVGSKSSVKKLTIQ